jgi:3-isopropylmalate dehydrogenase
LGLAAIKSHGTPVPESTLADLETLDAWVLGPHDSASYPAEHRDQLNPSGTIRKRFGLFANIRPAKALLPEAALAPDTDLVIVRENTQGFYSDRATFAGTGEYMPSEDVAIAMGIFTREAIERIARTALTIAGRRRKHLTIVHKANVLRMTTGMFRDVCLALAASVPEVQVDTFHIDAMAARLVRHAGQFDVIVAENMFGDILSDLAGELAGSLGIAPSLNHSEHKAMAQAAHGSAPDIAGRGVANPIAMIGSTAMLLDWLGDRERDPALQEAAAAIDAAVQATLDAGTATPDLGGSASTMGVAHTVAEMIKQKGAPVHR